MFVSFDPARDWGGYDYVIIGAGVAGLFLAEKFAAHGRVLVLEAGGTDVGNADGDGYYNLDVTGRGYAPLGQRLTVFGGTSNHWGGHSHPMNPVIFDNRKDIPGWPITYQDYALHLPEAMSWLSLGAFDKEPGSTGIERDLLGHAQNLQAFHFQFSNPVRRFGDAPTQQHYSAAPAIDVVVNTRVTDIVLNDGGTGVKQLEVFHLPSGGTATVPVKQLFLCSGGIDNPRLMLWSARKYQAGNPLGGGPNNLTGKYFMEHPSLTPVEIYVDGRADVSALAPHMDAGRMVNIVLSASDDFLAQHDLPRFGMHFQDQAQPASNDIEIRAAQNLFVSRSSQYQRLTPFFIFEQSPHQGSYVTLSQQMGKDGTPLARLNWYIPIEEIARYRQAVMMFCGLLNQGGLAKTRIIGDALGDDWDKLYFGDAAHHMGTTRMAHTPAGGVVNSDCKVFGLDNMYIAGSSVFPSTDIVNPTLNLTALTARLARLILDKAATAVGAVYRFGTGRDAQKSLGKGWSTSEATGIWSDGDAADLTLARNGASKLTFLCSANGAAQVEVEINGASVYKGAANALSGQVLPLGADDKVMVDLAFTDIVTQKDEGRGNDTRQLGIFLQSVSLQ
jgi:choline dehydrogenase-like flavoprotein